MTRAGTDSGKTCHVMSMSWPGGTCHDVMSWPLKTCHDVMSWPGMTCQPPSCSPCSSRWGSWCCPPPSPRWSACWPAGVRMSPSQAKLSINHSCNISVSWLDSVYWFSVHGMVWKTDQELIRTCPWCNISSHIFRKLSCQHKCCKILPPELYWAWAWPYSLLASDFLRLYFHLVWTDILPCLQRPQVGGLTVLREFTIKKV